MLLSIRSALILATLMLFGMAFSAHADDNKTSIEHVLMKTWDKPNNPLVVDPIVIVNNWAMASWTQGERGGRALLKQDKHGSWQVYVCGGDSMKDINILTDTGMSSTDAKSLSKKVNEAETNIVEERRALFSTFDGVMKMDSHHHH